ncbi:MAG: DUF4956 domain-containing protein [Lachnospiraceae bacterium]|nr:DUF4956 domain-containing protein [Lachnospiraceae bacterium]
MRDVIYEYFAKNTGELSIERILLNFGAALVFGLIIFVCYRYSHAGTMYSSKFNVSLVMLTLITTLVMSVIGNNVALSLGMVGALSIVRFRTAIKDSRDTAFIFWCIAVGICCGVSEFRIAGIGSVVLFLFLLVFGRIQNNDRFLLIIRGNRSKEKDIERSVAKYYSTNAKVKVKNSTKDSIEYIYELSQKMIRTAEKSNAETIMETIYKIDDIKYVNLVCQNDELYR